MAAASAVPAANTNPYRPQPPSTAYPSGYPPAAPQSSVQVRRTSDESDSLSTHRRSQQSEMSLPPLHEALNSAPLSASSESREPLRSLPPPHPYSSRPPPPESFSSFPAPSRSTLSARTNAPPPLPMIDRHQQAPQSYTGRDRDADFRQTADAPPPPQLSGGYSHYPQQHTASSQHGTPLYTQHLQRPPGQLPLPSLPPTSPRQPGSAVPSPLDTGRPPYHPDEEYDRNKYEGPLGRSFDAYPYLDALNKVSAPPWTSVKQQFDLIKNPLVGNLVMFFARRDVKLTDACRLPSPRE